MKSTYKDKYLYTHCIDWKFKEEKGWGQYLQDQSMIL